MSPIVPVKMQSLEYQLGRHLAERYCAPLAFFMVMRAHGYISKRIMPGEFISGFDHGSVMTSGADWSRPALSRMLRKTYKAPIVSWVLQPEYDRPDLMKRAGYVETATEVTFYNTHVRDHSVEDLVRAGYPVIVTMKPGFGSDENRNIHAVVIGAWTDEQVSVFDPDARNTQFHFSADRVNAFIITAGAGSIILPKL